MQNFDNFDLVTLINSGKYGYLWYFWDLNSQIPNFWPISLLRAVSMTSIWLHQKIYIFIPFNWSDFPHKKDCSFFATHSFTNSISRQRIVGSNFHQWEPKWRAKSNQSWTWKQRERPRNRWRKHCSIERWWRQSLPSFSEVFGASTSRKLIQRL